MMSDPGFVFRTGYSATAVTAPTLATCTTMYYSGELYPNKNSKFEAEKNQRINREVAGMKKARETFSRLKSKRKKK